MAFIVLGVGALMVVAGAGEIYYGSGFLEIERGWSTFIAGTILLTGGVLTMALGLALRSLGEFRGALRQLGGMDGYAPPHRRGAPEIAIPARDPPVALHPADGATALAGAAALQIEPHFGGGVAPIEAEDASPPLRLRDEPDLSSGIAPAIAAATAVIAPSDPRYADPTVRESSDVSRDGIAPVVELAEPHGDAPIAAPHEAYAEPEPVYADYVELPEPAALEQPAATIEAVPPPVPSYAPPPQPAVIGRYEAEGTSYVMYADGSIEAQSEAGVYRFASMAELKSFIET